MPWRNFRGPARLLSLCATVLLVASGLIGVEASIMLILGPARNIVVKPFVLLGYLEVCAVFFSLVGIVCAIVGLIFYRPYLYLSEKIMFYRARRRAEVSDEHTHFEDADPVDTHNPEEDGAPD
jgi:hypothetical protein